MENQINISKVALQHGMFLKVSFTEPLPNDDQRKHPNVSCAAPVHQDLTKSFNDFTPHLALICEQISNEEFIESMPEEYDATAPSIVEMGELVPAIKATRSKKKDAQLSVIPDVNATAKSEPKLIDKFSLSDVEFKFQNGIESIKLTGQMQLSTMEWIGLGPSPWIKINGEYPYLSDLFQLGEVLKYETQEYIINHKYAPVTDPELPFGDGVGIEEEQY